MKRIIKILASDNAKTKLAQTCRVVILLMNLWLQGRNKTFLHKLVHSVVEIITVLVY